VYKLIADDEYIKAGKSLRKKVFKEFIEDYFLWKKKRRIEK